MDGFLRLWHGGVGGWSLLFQFMGFGIFDRFGHLCFLARLCLSTARVMRGQYKYKEHKEVENKK